jgi:UDP-glucose 4-epimerase
MTSIVTGGAGFIANTLITKLIEENRKVVVLDNFKLGNLGNIQKFVEHPNFRFLKTDVSSRSELGEAFSQISQGGPIEEVWHLAANSDIPSGVAEPDVDLKDTFLTTFELLRCIKTFKVSQFLFASSSAIYGDQGSAAIHENVGPLFPISNYGAMKLASEAQISAAVESHLEQALLFRFPNVVGIPATHGVILDFVRKLKAKPTELAVLGDGTQQKAYLHVSDLVAGMIKFRNGEHSKLNAINIGPTDDGVTVRWIAEMVVARVSPKARITFGKGNKGWVGDIPRFCYSTDKAQGLGWAPKLTSEGAILRAIDEIASQEGL